MSVKEDIKKTEGKIERLERKIRDIESKIRNAQFANDSGETFRK